MAHIAIKRLTKSDLSFFARHVHESKQKGVNFNADVFVDLFYPGLADSFATILFPLAIIGPGDRPRQTLTRKVVRTPGAKNWRLNGEVVNDPADDPDRYEPLRPDDFGVFAFEGSEQPTAMTLVLVSASLDGPLHRAISALSDFADRQSMAALDDQRVASLIRDSSSAYAVHPLESLIRPDSVEDAIFGSAAAQDRAAKGDGRGLPLSPDALRRQMDASSESGRRGEELFARMLADSGHSDEDWDWVSLDHARASYDFEVRRPRWESIERAFVDVKATKGDASTPFHMSRAEVRWAALHPEYRIARVCHLASGGAEVRILRGVQAIAKEILEAAANIPHGVMVDSFELSPNLFEVLATSAVSALPS